MSDGGRRSDDAYRARVDRAMDHVRAGLGDDLSLAAVADVAGFSPHHFHRIFKAVAGETLAQFTRRARLERAVRLMRAAPARTLTSISAEVGFATPSDFARVFRTAYGCRPSEWDRRSPLVPARGESGGIDDREPDRPGGDHDPGRCRLETTVVTRPACRLAYVRVRDPWRSDGLVDGYDRLTRRLSDAGVDWRRAQLVGLSWESAPASPRDRLTYDLALTVADDLGPLDGVGIHHLPAARAAEVRCRTLPGIAVAWEHLYRCWLPSSGSEPEEVPAVKWFRHTPERFGPQAWDVDCSIAIRPLRR